MSKEERRKESCRKYYLKNKDKIIEHKKEYNSVHRKKRREYAKNFYETHKEEIREQKKKYRDEHKEEIRDYAKKYRLENKERYKISGNINWVNWRESKRLNGIKYMGGKCIVCGLIDNEVMEFHHINGKEGKEDSRPYLRKNFEMRINNGEFMLLCANCHRRITRKNGWNKNEQNRKRMDVGNENNN